MRLLRLVPETPHIPFMRWHKPALALSLASLLGSIVLLFLLGINFGIDFKGGTLIEVRTAQTADLPAMRDNLNSLGLGDVSLQEFGAEDDVLIRVPLQAGEGEEVQQAAVQQVQDALDAAFPGIEYRRVEFVGPQVSGELIEKGVIAVVVAVIFMMAYVWLRFEWQFGVGAVLALVHDVVATIGLFSLTQIDFDLPVVAALLTIVGYSMNDTVVVYDRIRENLRKYKQENVATIIDRSLNETLSRTVNTALTTLLALGALYIFGGEVIAPFVLAMIWGVLIGTYSSVFIGAPFLLYLRPVRRNDSGEAVTQNEETSDPGTVRR
jgi:preprotein translocase subunit SecF